MGKQGPEIIYPTAAVQHSQLYPIQRTFFSHREGIKEGRRKTQVPVTVHVEMFKSSRGARYQESIAC
jgi:hypothetical protein